MSLQKDITWENEDGFVISTNKSLLDIDVIHTFLSQASYWVNGIDKQLVEASIENSAFCFGVYEKNADNHSLKQIGYARVVSDLVRYSWLADVFILPEYRGRGLSKWLIQTITELPKLRGTNFTLSTKDAHTLYAQYGFKPIENIEYRMIKPINWDAIYEDYKLNRD